MILKLEIINQLKIINTWIVRVFIVAFVIFISYKYFEFTLSQCLWYSFFYSLFLVVPPVLGQLWYSRQSRRYVIILQDSTFSGKKDGKTNNYSYSDVELILYNKFASYDNGSYTSGLEPLRNLQIFTNDGEVYFITCLMYYKVENLIDFFEKREVKVVVNNGSIGFKNKIPANC